MTESLATSPCGSGGTGLAEPVPFEELYRRHAAGVHRYCVSQVGDWALAEDLTHETFARAFAAYGRARPEPDSLRAWLLAIARNASADHHRRRGRRARLELRLAAAAPPDADAQAIAQVRLEVQRVVVAMAALREADRQAIGLRVAADLSFREIGKVLGMSEAAAKATTYRALAKLRGRLEETR